MSIERPNPLVIVNGVMNQTEGSMVKESYDHVDSHQLALATPIDHQSFISWLHRDTSLRRYYFNDTRRRDVPPLYDWRLVDADGNQFSDAFYQVDPATLHIANLQFNPHMTGWSWLPERVETTIDQAPWVGGVQFSPDLWEDRRNGYLGYAERQVNSLGRVSLLEIRGDDLYDQVDPSRLAIEIGFLAVNDNSYALLRVPADGEPTSLLPYLEALYEKRDYDDLSNTGMGVSGIKPGMESLAEVLNEFPDISIAFDEDSIDNLRPLNSEYIKQCLGLLDRKV